MTAELLLIEVLGAVAVGCLIGHYQETKEILFMAKLKKMLSKKEVTVQEIHDEFDNACDAFLDQIKEVLKETSETDIENASKLKNLGFYRAGNVKKYDEIITSAKDAREAKAYVEDYATRYTEKFITENMVGIICKKYGLVLGETSNFIGEIPTKNTKEIIEFSKRFIEKDRRISYTTGFMASNSYNIVTSSISDHFRNRGMIGYDRLWGDNKPRRDDLEFPAERQERMLRQQEEAVMKQRGANEQAREDRQVDPTFMVVGTLDQFNMIGKKVDSSFKIVSDNPDPVVLAQVRGGFLIVTKWGAEADMQEFHNEKEN